MFVQTLDFEIFATVSRSCCRQNSSTVELIDGRRVVAGRKKTYLGLLTYSDTVTSENSSLIVTLALKLFPADGVRVNKHAAWRSW